MHDVLKKLTIDKDGLEGYIKDVTGEDWYKNPDITLYDQFEYDSYELACEFAELLGVHLNKEEIGDFSLAKEVTSAIMGVLEKEFKIPFPTFGSKNEETVTNEHVADCIQPEKPKDNWRIKICYSWGDEESDIKCESKEAAWKTAKELALAEAYNFGIEHDSKVTLYFDKQENRIQLYYEAWNEYCYYAIEKE